MTGPIEENKIFLYHAPTSPFCRRTLMACKYAGVSYEIVPVDLKNKEWLKDVYPEARIPIIKYNDLVIPESMVIMELVHELYPKARLFPTDPFQKASMKATIRFVEDRMLQTIRKLFGGPMTKDIFGTFMAETTATYYRINGLLLEQAPSGPYFLGADYSAADIAMAPFIDMATNFIHYATGRDLAVVGELPRLQTFIKGILEHPAFKETCMETKDDMLARFGPRFGMTQNMFADKA